MFRSPSVSLAQRGAATPPSPAPTTSRPGTTGTAVPGYDLKILDDAGAPVPDGSPGALYVRGASAATGYWSRYDASRQVFQGDWLRTGDTYVRDPDGVELRAMAATVLSGQS